ncbi:MAG: glycosyltransferase family 4 protein [Candidatus Thermoplasmatota archaeon]|jgi:glycosyltransferase involved in cell wall biosynthesis|nr:glycosyltransferase family 4 protein [Candidatus Thermoplasmatota archaeon]MCL5983410.1 glycosyltransferase family 4 protein [Candidatus Thermoplasmatota archaeon]
MIGRSDRASERTLQVVELTQRYFPALGGVERHVRELSTGMSEAGVAVEVVTSDLRRDRPFSRLPRGADHPAFPVRRHRALRAFPAPHGLGIVSPGMLVDALTRRPGVLHAHAFGYFPTWVGRFARAARRGPLIVTPHYDGEKGPRLYARTVARATLVSADRVIALTGREADALTVLGIDRDRIRIIPNGISLVDFLPPRTRDPAVRPVTALYVGRIEPEQKGLEDLLRAMALISSPDTLSLRVAGEDWGGESRLRDLARDLGIARRITWIGTVSEEAKRAEYAEADLLVLPSRFEPFGIVLLEAMAAGLPTVATRVGGIPEVVADGVTGRLVPPRDPTALAEALQALASDPSLRWRLGRSGQERARAFAWPVLLPRFLALFREVAEEYHLPSELQLPPRAPGTVTN